MPVGVSIYSISFSIEDNEDNNEAGQGNRGGNGETVEVDCQGLKRSISFAVLGTT
jgi:hypothetical protein